MDKKTKLWINLMEWCAKYWGCHQLPERSFFYHGYQFPVCARCTGIVIGYLIALLQLIFKISIPIQVCIIMVIPMAIDGMLQLFTSYTSNNLKRLFTGIFSGIGFLQLIINIISHLICALA